MALTADNLSPSPSPWSDIPPVSYQLTDDEVRATQTPNAQVQKTTGPIWIANVVIQLINALLHIGRDTVADRVIGAFSLVAAALFASQFWLGRRRLSSQLGQTFSLSFDELGIRCAKPLPSLIPWKSIDSVQDLGSVLIFTQPMQRYIIVPKRVFADAGAQLWAILVDQLIAKSPSLRRRADSRTIVNTAIR